MKKLNHYQKDILFITLIIILQIGFTLFYPFLNPSAQSSVYVNQSFIFLEFNFIDINETTTFFPLLTGIYAFFLIVLLLRKPRSLALIYGFALVLVAKIYYMSELYALAGTTYSDLTVNGRISQTLTTNGEVVAQDISLYILAILLLIKIAIYFHDNYMRKKIDE